VSFKSVLLKVESVVGNVLGGIQAVAPEVNALLPIVDTIPVFGPLAAEIIPIAFGATNAMETLITGVQQGQAKQQSAIAILQAQTPNLESVIAIIGKNVGLSPAALNMIPAIVNGAVAISNAVAEFEAQLQAQVAATPKPPVVAQAA
jgi:hypothetical protein